MALSLLLLSGSLLLLAPITTAADCYQPRTDGSSGTDLSNTILGNNELDLVCTRQIAPFSADGKSQTYDVGKFTIQLTRQDTSTQFTHCSDAINDIVSQCIVKSSFFGGNWTLDGQTYDVWNRLLSGGAATTAGPTTFQTQTKTQTSSSSSKQTSSSSSKQTTSEQSSTTATPSQSTTSLSTITPAAVITSAVSPPGVSSNTLITTSKDGHSTIVPILFGCFFCPAAGGLLLFGIGPGPGIYSPPVPPPFPLFPPITIGSDGKPTPGPSPTTAKPSNTPTTTPTATSTTSAGTQTASDCTVICKPTTSSQTTCFSTTCIKTVGTSVTGTTTTTTQTPQPTEGGDIIEEVVDDQDLTQQLVDAVASSIASRWATQSTVWDQFDGPAITSSSSTMSKATSSTTSKATSSSTASASASATPRKHPSGSPACQQGSAIGIPQQVVISGGNTTPKDLQYRMREVLCNNKCAVPSSVPSSAVAVTPAQDGCEISIILPESVEAYAYRGTASTGDEWQDCWDSFANITETCKLDGPNTGWVNGPDDFQFYQNGYRMITDKGAKHGPLNPQSSLTDAASATPTATPTSTQTPASSTVFGLTPTSTDLSCVANSQGGFMADCWNLADSFTPDQKICTNDGSSCKATGQSFCKATGGKCDPNGSESFAISSWCTLASYQSCAIVVADKLASFGFPGFSCLTGQDVKNLIQKEMGTNGCGASPDQGRVALWGNSNGQSTLCMTGSGTPGLCAA